ncbi:MAG: aminotransferase class I/II-fold pyridoxal phosphate-dependent enzyme [Spirochaetaceae bacterium]|jgi:histidinol-phosphate aminotransferase|nr:aminotransferase class I/II-fold pyridoxal phosphate-dependent enzyme [Spirochaetaceae bacterium]
MSGFWNKRARGLEPYVPGEQPRERRLIKLNTNENPYPPSPKALAAIREAAAADLRLYPDPLCTVLREAVAETYRVKPEQVFPGNGSDEVLAFAFAAFFPSAGEGGVRPVLFPDITYSFYPVYAGLWDIPVRTVPLTGDFSVNAEDYLYPAGGVIFPNPNAPTGRALPLRDILSVAGYQGKAGRVVIVDEAYGAFGGESAVPHIGEFPNLLTVHTLSKAASLAGLRVGFAIGREELIQGLCRLRDSFNSYTLDRLALAGAAAAVSDGAYYHEINRKVIATRERVSGRLRELGFEVIPSAANFIFIRRPRLSGAEIFAALRERGILVRRFDTPRIRDYLRVSMGTDKDMDEFLEFMEAVSKRAPERSAGGAGDEGY